ncbi:hypothetical protein M1105_08875 [Limibaculum sp. FT325]|uniref:hypothetical protein n=1 Tax=Thermohalobaculum sediminis TaxID=2939436 RepID=UPI0020C0E8A7|nr:hypothetical protein [Limibaculum sediminis]MCL5777097.1 hypothetical protein [Limibaculum sediminis]
MIRTRNVAREPFVHHIPETVAIALKFFNNPIWMPQEFIFLNKINALNFCSNFGQGDEGPSDSTEKRPSPQLTDRDIHRFRGLIRA